LPPFLCTSESTFNASISMRRGLLISGMWRQGHGVWSHGSSSLWICVCVGAFLNSHIAEAPTLPIVFLLMFPLFLLFLTLETWNWGKNCYCLFSVKLPDWIFCNPKVRHSSPSLQKIQFFLSFPTSFWVIAKINMNSGLSLEPQP
jgi:hypothetical protein